MCSVQCQETVFSHKPQKTSKTINQALNPATTIKLARKSVFQLKLEHFPKSDFLSTELDSLKLAS